MSNGSRSGLAVGMTVFAGVMLMMAGAFQFLAGLAGIFNKDSYVYVNTKQHSYWLHLSTTGWGWIHLLLGIIVFFAGLAILRGQVWGRTVGVIAAVASAVSNFAFIPVYPVWAIVVITLDVLVIWALTAHGRDITMG